MNAEVTNWIEYAAENLQVATLCLESGLFNSALQNSQQCVEKALKARLLFLGRRIRRTHAIKELCLDLQKLNITAGLSKDECELMDSIYLPSKYPLGSVFSKYEPDERVTRRCVEIAERTLREQAAAITR